MHNLYKNEQMHKNEREKMTKKKSNKIYNKGIGSKGTVVLKLVLTIIWLAIVAGGYYLFLPALNIHSVGMWMFFIFVCCVPATAMFGVYYLSMKLYSVDTKATYVGGSFGLGLIIFAVVLVGLFCGAKLFHAKQYASILKVEETDFITDIDQATAVTKIALMDTNSAIILGNREIGSLSKVVSQYNVSEDYTQIDLKGNPVKVAALDYAGFFKYTGNKDNGIPGYVKVDPVNQNAEYVEVEKGMNYVPSAYFSRDLKRHIRFKYPTKILKYIHFEVNEEG